MKYIKKTISIICAAVCATTPFALAACGGDDTPANNNTSGEVTAEQWKEAFKATKELNNYTETYSYVREYKDDGITRRSIVTKFDKTIIESHEKDVDRLKNYYIAKDYKIFNILVENNEVSAIGKKLWPWNEDTDVTALLKHKTYSVLSDEQYFYVQFVSKAGATGLLEELYSAFDYNSENKCYSATLRLESDGDEDSKDEYNYTIAIENSYVTNIKIDGENLTDHYQLTDINKTSISVPGCVWTAIQEYKEEDLI